MVVIGSDHGGLELKQLLVEFMRKRGIEARDMGTHGGGSVDYPDFGRLVSLAVSRGDAERGILICTSGIGMSILANKFPGIRAALVHDPESARISREHNNSNVLVLAGKRTRPPVAEKILECWLETRFDGGRHQRRLNKIARVEQELGTHIQKKPENN